MSEREKKINEELEDLKADELNESEAELVLSDEIEKEMQGEVAIEKGLANIERNSVIEKELPEKIVELELPADPVEDAVPVRPSLEAELYFLLGKKHLPLTEIRSLLEGKVIKLGGPDFQVEVTLQEKAIAQAKLILVEGCPSLQITKVFRSS